MHSFICRTSHTCTRHCHPVRMRKISSRLRQLPERRTEFFYIFNGKSVTDTYNTLNAFRSFFGSLTQINLPSVNHHTCFSDMEAASFGSNEQLLNTEACIEDIENALNLLKLGKYGGPDGLSPEQIVYGGEVLKIWLRPHSGKLKHLPQCMKNGIVVPVYKRQDKDPLLVTSYSGITLSSVLSKILELILLQHLSSLLDKQGFSNQLQTAYQKGVSCIDAIFATQETLTNHPQDGGKPYLCFFNIEKAFDFVELPVLLKHIFDTGVPGKFWRLIKKTGIPTQEVMFIILMTSCPGHSLLREE